MKLIMFISALTVRRLYLFRDYRHQLGKEKLKTTGKAGKLNEWVLLWFGWGLNPHPNRNRYSILAAKEETESGIDTKVLRVKVQIYIMLNNTGTLIGLELAFCIFGEHIEV
jgi:hypothetical protein